MEKIHIVKNSLTGVGCPWVTCGQFWKILDKYMYYVNWSNCSNSFKLQVNVSSVVIVSNSFIENYRYIVVYSTHEQLC